MTEDSRSAPLSESEVLSTRLWAENNLASKGSLDERIHSFYTNILALCDQALRSEIAPTRDAVLEEAALLADHEADRQSLFASEAEAKGDNSLSLTHGMIAYTLMHLAQRIRALKNAAGQGKGLAEAGRSEHADGALTPTIPAAPDERAASAEMEDMRVSLGCCLALMAQSGDERCMEMARRVPWTMKNGEPYAPIGLEPTGTQSERKCE